jgi:hypothetical protein
LGVALVRLVGCFDEMGRITTITDRAQTPDHTRDVDSAAAIVTTATNHHICINNSSRNSNNSNKSIVTMQQQQ